MKNYFLLPAFVFFGLLNTYSQDNILHLHSKNYNNDGKIIDHKGKLYTGQAKEKLKGEGYLIGKVNKGENTGVWEYYEHKTLIGYHHYLSNGDTTFSYDLKGNIIWADIYEKQKDINVYLDNNKEIVFLKSKIYDKKGKDKNMFDFQVYKENYFQSTLSDYDYTSNVVIDYFESKVGEQEIIIKNLESSQELLKVICDNHIVKEIYLNGDILENPEDADYKLDEHFDVSFTEVENHENFSIHLMKDKKIIFDVSIKVGEITIVDKYISDSERFIIYDKEKGYAPSEHEVANNLIAKLQNIANASVK